jgi:tetratricopeptide (TPR) repeat protein
MSKRKGAISRRAGPAGPGTPLEAADTAGLRVQRSWILTLAVLLVLRVALSLLPGMWLWGLNAPRFVSPFLAAAGLAVMALALLPASSRRLVPAVHWLGELASRAPWASRAAWAAVAVGTVAALPDRTHFTGDFMLREQAVFNQLDPADVFPQAFRLDVWLHHTLPLKLVAAGAATPNGAARMTGMLEAALLAVVAVELSRMLRLRGVASCFVTAAVLFGGGLACLTGLGKAFSELTVLGAAVALFGLRIALLGSGLGLGGLAFACALLLHRSAILLAPVLVVPFVLALRSRRAPAWPEALLGIGAPLAALAWVAGPLMRTSLGFDRTAGYLGMPASVAELALNAADVVNLLLLLAPALVLVLGWRGRAASNAPAAAVWVAFALPFGLLAVSVRHSGQGLFRDWDMFAALAAPLCVLAAVRVGQQLENLRRQELWIGVAALAAVVVPSLLWLGSQADLQSGMRRARAFALEAPRRPDDVRGRTWAFLTGRYVELDDYREAVTAGRMAATFMPTRNVLLCLAGSEKNIGENAAALADFRRMIALDRSDAVAWYNIATLAAGLGDFSQADEALRGLGATSAGAEVLPLATALVARERQRQAAGPPGPATGP